MRTERERFSWRWRETIRSWRCLPSERPCSCERNLNSTLTCRYPKPKPTFSPPSPYHLHPRPPRSPITPDRADAARGHDTGSSKAQIAVQKLRESANERGISATNELDCPDKVKARGLSMQISFSVLPLQRIVRHLVAVCDHVCLLQLIQ